LFVALAILASAACARPAGPQSVADSITRAVYANDYDGTTSPLDNQTRSQVTRAKLGDLSDKMHALGSYEGLTQTIADPDRGVYQYDAKFSRGHMTVWMRVDPTGKVGGYRLVPGAPERPPPSSSPAA
jgi:hypothetical protein